MNGWNEHNATNANRAARAPQDRVLWAASLALGACLLAAPACFAAEGAAPAMAGVKEFVLQYPHLGGSSQQAPPCGMTAGEANDALLRVLKAEGLPVVPIIDAKPSMIGVARVEILPEIISINNQDIDCTSWVSLTV
ncbi:MAG: hypothetical protein HGA90_03505, partial [Alphaproteobacteria bacterium]|nr:hypothetical protein [Alphaproteobacteria bacterium]